jgi:hypothetical protein
LGIDARVTSLAGERTLSAVSERRLPAMANASSGEGRRKAAARGSSGARWASFILVWMGDGRRGRGKKRGAI